MIVNFEIFPNLRPGYTFKWELSPSNTIGKPWRFWVQESETGRDSWRDISPELTNLMRWTEEDRKKFTPERKPYFRVRGLLGTGAGTEVFSSVRDAYADLSKRDFVLVKEIYRKELLQMEKAAGTPVTVWMAMKDGEPCTRCLDPITGEVLDSHCDICLGTGVIGAAHGPYDAWGTFSQTQSHEKHSQGGAGMEDTRIHQLRMLGSWNGLRRDDLVIDTPSQRIYVIDKQVNLAEYRRIPLAIQFEVHELDMGSILYKLSNRLLAGASA
jgi:hypothetical protein